MLKQTAIYQPSDCRLCAFCLALRVTDKARPGFFDSILKAHAWAGRCGSGLPVVRLGFQHTIKGVPDDALITGLRRQRSAHQIPGAFL